MFSVTHLDGRCEPLTNIKDALIDEEVNGAFGLSLTSFFNDNPGYDLLENESVIEYGGHEYRVKNLSRKRTNKSIRANHVFFDLQFHHVEGIQGGTRYANEQAAFILNGTGWTYEIQGTIEPQLFLEAFGNDGALKLIRLMCETLKCEVKIMPNKHLIFAKEVGPDNDFQFRYRYNVIDLTETTDTDDLFTAIKGYGANGLEVEHIAGTASIYGKRYADSIIDEDFTVAADLLEHIQQELGDRHLPKLSIDVSIVELQEQGYSGVPELGERIWLIHEPLGLEISTRVMKRKRNPLKKGGLSVTLSNIKPTFTDVLVDTQVEIDKNKREYRSRIHQTNEMIALEVQRLDGEFVEAYSLIELTADQIRLEVSNQVTRLDGRVDSAFSSITQTADSIRSLVQTTKNELSTDIDSALNSANSYTNGVRDTINLRITTAESSITQLSNAITLKVSQTVYEEGLMGTLNSAKSYADGQLTPIRTRLTTAESSITQLSNSIELRVSEAVYESTVEMDQDIQNLANRVYSAESTLAILPGEISSKVSKTDYNGVEMISRINQTASSVAITASKIDLNGITRVNKRLQIGELSTNGEEKAIWFNNYAAITTYNGTTSLEIDAFGDLFLSGNTVRFDSYFGGSGAYVDFSTARGIDWGSHVPPAPYYVASSGNADMVDGYHASDFSLSGHVHSDTQYVKPSSGQAIQIGVSTSQGRLNVYLGGSLVGFINFS